MHEVESIDWGSTFSPNLKIEFGCKVPGLQLLGVVPNHIFRGFLVIKIRSHIGFTVPIELLPFKPHINDCDFAF